MIEEATEDDAGELAAIKREASRRAYGELMTPEQLEWWFERVCSPDRFIAYLSRDDVDVLIDHEARAIGVVSHGEAAYLADVYVERPRLGAGGRMVEELIERGERRGAVQAECSVMEWNEPATAFWERIGFRRGKMLTSTVWDPEGLMRSAGVMRSRDLPTSYLAYVRPLRAQARPSR